MRLANLEIDALEHRNFTIFIAEPHILEFDPDRAGPKRHTLQLPLFLSRGRSHGDHPVRRCSGLHNAISFLASGLCSVGAKNSLWAEREPHARCKTALHYCHVYDEEVHDVVLSVREESTTVPAQISICGRISAVSDTYQKHSAWQNISALSENAKTIVDHLAF